MKLTRVPSRRLGGQSEERPGEKEKERYIEEKVKREREIERYTGGGVKGAKS